jgi:hypothetical protein
MRLKFYAWAALALLAGAVPSLASLGEVVDSYFSPAETYNSGLGVSPSEIYVGRRYNPIAVYRCDIETGSVKGSWQTPPGAAVDGIAYVARGRCWCNRYLTNVFYACDYTTGSVYKSWTASYGPYGLAPLCTGDGGLGTTRLLANSVVPAKIYEHRLDNGSVTNVINVPSSANARWDIAYDWRNNVIWGSSSNGDQIYGYSYDTGSLVASFQSPVPLIKGLAYTGSYLYASSDNSGLIYKIHCPGDIGVAPASAGRIKALFQ